MDFAIVMECEVSKEGIDMRATFDHNILSRAEVERMFLYMEDILRRIMFRIPSMLVLDLQRISETELLQACCGKVAYFLARTILSLLTLRFERRPKKTCPNLQCVL